MAQYGETYGRQMTDEYGNPIRETDEYGNPIRQTDEYGNPIRQTDVYGNPIHHTGGGGGGGGGTMGDYGTTGGAAYQNQYGAIGFGGAAYQNHYSAPGGAYGGSGIASAGTYLEDDEYGHGGKRNKGLNEKPPGAHRADGPAAYSTSTTAPGSAYGHDYGVEPPRRHQKKGIMDKIKDKLGHRY